MLILERFEGDIAIIENDGERLEMSRKMVSENAGEGDVLTLESGLYIPDLSATEKRRAEVLKKQNSLWG